MKRYWNLHVGFLSMLAFAAFMVFPAGRIWSQENNAPVKVEENGMVAQSASSIERAFEDILSRTGKNFHYDKLSATDIYLFLAGIILTLFIARMFRWVLEKYISRLASKTETKMDDLVFEAIGRPISLVIFSIGLYCSCSLLFPFMSEKLIMFSWKTCTAIAAVAVAWAAFRLVSVVDYLVGNFANRSDNNLDHLVVPAISRTLKFIVILFSILFIGKNIFNFDVTTLLAGAGVAGLAIAFAAQDTIANVFGSIMVIIDQPFKAGELIKVDDITGRIELIGFRSTKLRTLKGHLVVIPNKNMANATIENISKRPSIKHEMNLTLVYDTSAEDMEKAIRILKEVFDKHENMNSEFPPKIFFNSFNDWSLNIYVVTWYFSNDYFEFLGWVHRNNLEILRRFNKEGLKFAFPTNTTYLMTDPALKPEFMIKQ